LYRQFRLCNRDRCKEILHRRPTVPDRFLRFPKKPIAYPPAPIYSGLKIIPDQPLVT
jgi:hypothetical protein